MIVQQVSPCLRPTNKNESAEITSKNSAKKGIRGCSGRLLSHAHTEAHAEEVKQWAGTYTSYVRGLKESPR